MYTVNNIYAVMETWESREDGFHFPRMLENL
jgi:hypothetical protein